MQIRARVRKDLDVLRSTLLPELSPTVAIPNRDYPYRGYCTKEMFAKAMMRMALGIDYDNFKSEVTRVQGRPRHDLYTKVWGVMANAERDLEGMTADNKRWDKQRQLGWFGDEPKGKKGKTKKTEEPLTSLWSDEELADMRNIPGIDLSFLPAPKGKKA